MSNGPNERWGRRRRGGEVLKWGEREGRSTGPLLAEEMAFEWVCALRRMVGILEGRERRGRQAENYYAPLPLISFAWRVRKVQILSLLLAKKEEHLEGRKKEHLGAMSILLVTNLPSLSLPLSFSWKLRKEEHALPRRTWPLRRHRRGAQATLFSLPPLPSFRVRRHRDLLPHSRKRRSTSTVHEFTMQFR